MPVSALSLEPAHHRGRHPAVFVAAAIALGILLDVARPLPWSGWLTVTAVLLFAWAAAFRFRPGRVSSAILLAAVACLGGARHHQVKSVAEETDIARFAADESTPVRLSGRVISSPVIVSRREEPGLAAWLRPDRSFVLCECESVQTNHGHATASGVVRLQVSGHLLHVQPGDQVEAHGWLARPGAPQNPGQFDFRDRLARDGVRCLLYVDDPDSVTRLERPRWSIRRAIAGLRDAAEQVLTDNLRDDSLAIGSAILLGDRTQIDSDIRESFIRSGMMHVLAISGLHVGILAAFSWLTTRACGLSTRASAILVITIVIGYALITDVRPSIVRATIVITIVTIGRAVQRPVSPLNALGVAALVILLWNPRDLFDVGAQLSFLSVVGMIVAGTWDVRRPIRDPADVNTSRWHYLWNTGTGFAWWVKRMYVAMAGIWLFTTPLVAARFHVVSPVGLLVNIVLIPGVALVLGSGYLFVFGGLLIPPLQRPAAAMFDGSLCAMKWIVDRASGLSLGHYYVAGPTDGWMVVHYLLLASLVFVPAGRWRRLCWISLGCWIVGGLSVALVPEKPEGLRCTFLSIGHGVGVLVETPNGATLLYDAGSLGNSHRATATVQSAVWSRRKSRLDAIVVSHADVDHFNGVPGLLRSIRVRTLLCTDTFRNHPQAGAELTRKTAESHGVPIRTLRSGDTVRLDPAVTIRVLHPGRERFENDNANSVVLEIVYAGRRILLTGDLEKGGLEQVLELNPRHVDVMLAPHHGSPAANPSRLAAWASPDYVVASGGRRVKLQALQTTYEKSGRVFSTYRDGAITVEIAPNGDMRVTPFRQR